MVSSISEPAKLHALAERLGQLEGEVEDLQLRLEESRARERRLCQLLARNETTASDGGTIANVAAIDDLEQLRVREQLDLYTSYWVAIQRSRGWRALQFLRGLVGRRW